jgi:hypothetical protein
LDVTRGLLADMERQQRAARGGGGGGGGGEGAPGDEERDQMVGRGRRPRAWATGWGAVAAVP